MHADKIHGNSLFLFSTWPEIYEYISCSHFRKFYLFFLLLLAGVRPVFFDQWRKIDQVEQQRGKERGKPREKIVYVHEMLNIAYENNGS